MKDHCGEGQSLHATDEVVCAVANRSSGIKSSYMVHIHNAMLVIAFLQGLHHLVICALGSMTDLASSVRMEV